jgi:hypothetical protein
MAHDFRFAEFLLVFGNLSSEPQHKGVRMPGQPKDVRLAACELDVSGR